MLRLHDHTQLRHTRLTALNEWSVRPRDLLPYSVWKNTYLFRPFPVAVRSKGWVCCLSVAWTARSYPAGGVCCHAEVSASDWSLVQRNRTECGVPEGECEASILMRPWLTWGYCTMKIYIYLDINIRRYLFWEDNSLYTEVLIKVKQSHYRPGQVQRVLRNLRFPYFVTTAQDGGRLSALRTCRLYS